MSAVTEAIKQAIRTAPGKWRGTNLELAVAAEMVQEAVLRALREDGWDLTRRSTDA